jgi:cyclin-dependent kinase 7
MYCSGVDMWAVGCIIAELLLRVPFLPGESDLDQLTRIFHTLGTPTEQTWPVIDFSKDLNSFNLYKKCSYNAYFQGMTSLQDYIQFKSFPGTPLKDIFTAAGDDLLTLLSALLSINPVKRINCKQALKMPYFR